MYGDIAVTAIVEYIIQRSDTKQQQHNTHKRKVSFTGIRRNHAFFLNNKRDIAAIFKYPYIMSKQSSSAKKKSLPTKSARCQIFSKHSVQKRMNISSQESAKFICSVSRIYSSAIKWSQNKNDNNNNNSRVETNYFVKNNPW